MDLIPLDYEKLPGNDMLPHDEDAVHSAEKDTRETEQQRLPETRGYFGAWVEKVPVFVSFNGEQRRVDKGYAFRTYGAAEILEARQRA